MKEEHPYIIEKKKVFLFTSLRIISKALDKVFITLLKRFLEPS